jgi:hypothetical protein
MLPQAVLFDFLLAFSPTDNVSKFETGTKRLRWIKGGQPLWI